MRVIELQVGRSAFADTLGAMREWLDRNNCPSVRFETAGSHDGVLIKVEFDADQLAEEFGEAFGGEAR